jgi:hypothetical protein
MVMVRRPSRDFSNHRWNKLKLRLSDIIIPELSITKYLDLPKEQLLQYKDKAGLADILKICDRRIGYNRLKDIELSPAAKKIFDVRFKEKISKKTK